MRPARRPRAAASLVTALLAGVVLLGAGCSDDGSAADDQPTPTTTAPDDPTTSATTEPAETSSETTEADPATGGGADDPLTVETAAAELQSLMEAYRDALAEIRAAGALDERSLQTLTDAFTVKAAQQSISGLESRGGVTILAEDAAVPTVSDVEVVTASDTCAELSASIDGVAELITVPVEVVQPYTVRLVRAPEGSSGSAWRLDFLSVHPEGQSIPEGACP